MESCNCRAQKLQAIKSQREKQRSYFNQDSAEKSQRIDHDVDRALLYNVYLCTVIVYLVQAYTYGSKKVIDARKRSRSDGQQICSSEFTYGLQKPASKRPSSGQQLLHLQQLECTLRDCMLRYTWRARLSCFPLLRSNIAEHILLLTISYSAR
jgi:hypothetical protein